MAENKIRIIIEADAGKYQQAINQAKTALDGLSDTATATGRDLDAAWSTLGLRSAGEIKAEIKRVGDAYNTLKTDGTASARDLAVAHDQLKSKLKDLGSEYARVGFDGAASASKVDAAWRDLGLRSADEIKAEIKRIGEAYKSIRDSGTASAKDVAAAQEKVRKKIQDLRKEYQRLGSESPQQIKGVETGVSSLLSVVGQLRNVVAGLVLAETFRRSVREVWNAVDAIDAYEKRIISVAATLTDYNKGSADELKAIYEQNLQYATETYEKVELAAAQFFASGQELTEAWQILTNKGVVLTSEEDITNLGIIVDKIKLMTQGQTASLQIAQEIRSVMSGQARATDQIAVLLKDKLGPEWDKQLKKAVAEGRALEFVADQFKGMLAASEDIQGTIESQVSTLQTRYDQIVRSGFKEMHDDVVRSLSRINSLLEKYGQTISTLLSNVYRIAKILSALRLNPAKGVLEALEWYNNGETQTEGATTEPIVNNPPLPIDDNSTKKSKKNLDDLLKAAKDWSGAYQLLLADDTDKTLGETATRVSGWKTAYDTIADASGDRYDAELAALDVARAALYEHWGMRQ
uniref:hypothetical protein n=1 Tax=Desulfovibrio inopinatus TaxID=102109 RepID=UPI000558B2EA